MQTRWLQVCVARNVIRDLKVFLRVSIARVMFLLLTFNGGPNALVIVDPVTNTTHSHTQAGCYWSV